MEGCIFCNIASGKNPSAKVFENQEAVAVLDIAPIRKGQLLLITKEHHKDIFDIPKSTLKDMAALAQQLSIALANAISAKGVRIDNKSDSCAGQMVPHFSLSIIPCKDGDEQKPPMPGQYQDQEEMEYFRKKIANQVQSQGL